MKSPHSGAVPPLSVLLVVDTYPPAIGGSEIEAQRVSSALIRRGHHVQVLCSGGPPMPETRHWIDPAGVPTRILTRRSQARLKHIWYALQVGWIILTEGRRYDVIYFLMQGLHLATGLQAGHFLGKPMVMKAGGSGVIPLMRNSRVGRYELNWLQRWGVRLLVLNPGMVEEALADGFQREKITWMPNPVDMEEFRPPVKEERDTWRSQHDIPSEAQVIIYVGRLSHEKGLPELLRSFALAARSRPEATLVLLGDGPQRAELEALAASLPLAPQQIRFMGRVDIQTVPFWHRASDIFALVSPSEGLSCALLESMASGLPSVVCDIPANRQLVDSEVHGITVPFGDDAATAAAFERLLADPDLRQRMGRAARESVLETFSIDRVTERYEALFQELRKEAG